MEGSVYNTSVCISADIQGSSNGNPNNVSVKEVLKLCHQNKQNVYIKFLYKKFIKTIKTKQLKQLKQVLIKMKMYDNVKISKYFM